MYGPVGVAAAEADVVVLGLLDLHSVRAPALLLLEIIGVGGKVLSALSLTGANVEDLRYPDLPVTSTAISESVCLPRACL